MMETKDTFQSSLPKINELDTHTGDSTLSLEHKGKLMGFLPSNTFHFPKEIQFEFLNLVETHFNDLVLKVETLSHNCQEL
jgi:hypothetical protein